MIDALKPGADMHKKRDGETLRASLREVEQLVGSLPKNVTIEWDFYLKTALRGILQHKPLQAKKPKPQLNMADDESIDYAKSTVVDGDWDV